MRVAFLLATLLISIVSGFAARIDPECVKRKENHLSLHWQHPTDCTKFYKCTENNLKHEITCLNGKSYDPKRGRCTFDGGVCDLEDHLINNSTVPENRDICSTHLTGTHLPHPTHCKSYYVCRNKMAQKRTCNAGSYFNSKTANCESDTKRECWENRCLDQADGTFLSNTESCLGFFICHSGVPILQKCDRGTYYIDMTCRSDVKRSCWENFCIDAALNGNYLPDQNDCSTYYECSGQMTVKRNCQQGQFFDRKKSSCMPGVCPADETSTTEWPSTITRKEPYEKICSETQHEVFIPDEEDCFGFYVCYRGTARKQYCDDESFFDREKLICSPGTCPYSATTQETTTEESSTTDESTTEEITTQESTTDESTTVESTTEESTTKESTTEESTTKESTTDEPTTVESTTDESTTVESTTEESTTKESTTDESTTVESTTDESTTDESTTVESTTDESTTVESTTDESTTDEPTTVESTTDESTTAESTTDPTDPTESTTKKPCICPGGFIEGDFIEHGSNCSLFYICYNGTLNEHSCNKGNYYDPERKICTRRKPATCSGDSSQPLAIDAAKSEKHLSKRSIEPSDNCTCPGGYREGEFVAHPKDCEKFYICHGSELMEENCGSGKRFDRNQSLCISDVMQTCWTFVAPEDRSTCKGAADGTLIPHETQCDEYYECFGSTEIIHSCGIGNMFNGSLSKCVADISSVCWTPSTSYCAGKSNGQFMPHPTHCDHYYICHKNQTILQECPSGSWFDPAELVCRPDLTAACANPCKGISGSLILPHPDCKRFYQCTNGHVQVQKCPNGMYFDKFLQMCSPTAKCWNICDMQIDGTVFPSTRDKDTFFVCYDNVPTKVKCFNGTTFDKELLLCTQTDHESCEQYRCQSTNKSDITFPAPNDPNGFCICQGNKAIKQKCRNGDIFDRKSLICKGNHAGCNPNVCVGVPPGTVFPALNDINAFCWCNGNDVSKLNCTENRIFDPLIGVCKKIDSCKPNVCVNAADNTVFPAENDPHAFCLCKGKRAIKTDCPDGGLFERELRVCVLPRKAICDPDVCLQAAPNSIFSAFNDPKSYCVCRGGKAEIQSCHEGGVFDSKRLICQPFDRFCGSVVCDETNNNRVFPAVNDSHSFCVCAGNNPVKLSCPTNTTFNIVKSTCLRTNQSISLPPSEDQLCDGKFHQGEFIPHPGVCNKFFICYNGQLREQLCGLNAYFNLKEKVCLPISSNNPECIPELPKPEMCTCVGGHQEGNFVAHPNDCEKFYICFGGKLAEQTCGEGNFFDSIFGYCRKDIKKECPHKCTCPGGYDQGDLLAHPMDFEKFYICFDCEFVEQNCGIGNYFDSNEKRCRSQLEYEDCTCPGGYNKGDMISHPTDCDKYYICHDRQMIENSCGTGNFFNATTKSCMIDILDVCKSELDTCKCAGGYNEGVLLTHPTDCEKYYICFGGELKEQNCGVGNRFDHKTLSCIRDDRELCWVVLPPPKPPACTKANNGLWLPHETRCDKFYICSNSEKIVQICQPGFKFDSAASRCVADNDGTCWKMISNFCADKLNGTFIKHQKFCDHFYVCHNGSVHLQQCGASNWFNPEKMACEPDINRNCPTATASPDAICLTSPDNKLIPDPFDVTAFYVCQGRKAIKKMCPSNNVFNDKLQICVENVIKDECDSTICKFKSNAGSVFPSLTDPNGYCVCINGKAEKKSCQDGSTFNQNLSICQPVASKCARQTNGHLLAYPGDPTMFYVCENGVAIRRKCLPGQHFDNSLKVCRRMTRINNDVQERDLCSGKSNGLLLPGENCNKFIICMGNMSLEQTCGHNEAYDEVSGECRYDSDCQDTAFCSNFHRKRFAIANNYTEFVECKMGTLIYRKCHNDTVYDPDSELCVSSIVNQIEKNQICSTSNMTFKMAHSHHKFYGCYKNKTRLYECGNHFLHYDPSKELCINKRSQRTSNVNTALIKLTSCSEGEIFRNPVNCSEYKQCIDEIWIQKNCPKFHFFSENQQKCIAIPVDLNSNSEYSICKSQGFPELIGYNEVIETGNCSKYFRCNNRKCKLETCNEGEVFNRNLKTCLKGTCDSQNEIVTCTSNDVREDQQNCAMFHLCVNKIWWQQHCPDGMYFNNASSSCIVDNGTCPDTIKLQTILEENYEYCNISLSVKPLESACNQFYQCFNGQWIKQNCPSQFSFNPSVNACIPGDEWCVVSGRNSCVEFERRPNPFDCKSFEKCINQEWIIEKCSKDQLFDETINECIKNDGSCSENGFRRVCTRNDSKRHPIAENHSKFLFCYKNRWIEGGCLKGYTYNATQAMCRPNLNGKCTGQVDGTLVPHPTDCTKFHLCRDGEEIENNCFAGEYFNAIDGFCQKDVDGNCDKIVREICFNHNNGYVFSNSKDNASFYKCQGNESVLYLCPFATVFDNQTQSCQNKINNSDDDQLKRNICNNHNEIALISHEIYCNVFFVCSNEMAMLIECPQNHIFDSNLKKCKKKENEKCLTAHLMPGSATGATICENLLNGTLLSDQKNCKNYFICSNGQAIPAQCQNGTFFDSKNLQCKADQELCSAPTTPPVCTGKEVTMMADNFDCNQFFICINGNFIQERCHQDHFFNRSSLQCKLKSDDNDHCSVPRKNLTHLCSNVSDGKLIADQNDCRRFFECVDGEAKLQRCRNGESFDSILGFCRQNDGTCLLENGQRVGACAGKHGILTKNNDDCQAYYLCLNGQKIAKKCQNDEYFNKTAMACRKDVLNQCHPKLAIPNENEGNLTNLICSGMKENILYPNVNDSCRSYFECVNGEPQIYKCSDGSLFNSAIGRCVQDIVDCMKPVTATNLDF